MGGEGHMLDMIRRLSEGREASRLRRERNNEKLKHLNRSNEHYPLPNTTSEEMERIIRDSEKKKERDNSYFVWGHTDYHGRPDCKCRYTMGYLY